MLLFLVFISDKTLNNLQHILNDSDDDNDRCDLQTREESARSDPDINLSSLDDTYERNDAVVDDFTMKICVDNTRNFEEVFL